MKKSKLTQPEVNYFKIYSLLEDLEVLPFYLTYDDEVGGYITVVDAQVHKSIMNQLVHETDVLEWLKSKNSEKILLEMLESLKNALYNSHRDEALEELVDVTQENSFILKKLCKAEMTTNIVYLNPLDGGYHT